MLGNASATRMEVGMCRVWGGANLMSETEYDPHPGAIFVGIFLAIVLIHSLYVGTIRFSGLLSILLVTLALGSKALN